MTFAIPKDTAAIDEAPVGMKRGARRIIALFVITVGLAVSFHQYLNLAPFLGMLTGLALLKVFGYYLQMTHTRAVGETAEYGQAGDVDAFDSYREIARIEWDTLLFFFGVIMCVGALSFVGYLAEVSAYLYGQLGATTANVVIGVLSAILDNIPLMIAVLEMNPPMDLNQWLLITLTAGVGGSLLSIGSAAGVALMGQARGQYTFGEHLGALAAERLLIPAGTRVSWPIAAGQSRYSSRDTHRQRAGPLPAWPA
jgi:Na+/H+ antiporter NhaD/arsenite permease-like protein